MDYILCYGRDVPNVPNFAVELTPRNFPKRKLKAHAKVKKYRDDLAFYLSTLKTRPINGTTLNVQTEVELSHLGKRFQPDRPKPGDELEMGRKCISTKKGADCIQKNYHITTD